LSFDGVNQTVKINPDSRSITYNTTGFSTSVLLKPSINRNSNSSFTIGCFTYWNEWCVTVTIGSTTITSQANLVLNTYTNILQGGAVKWGVGAVSEGREQGVGAGAGREGAVGRKVRG
jgi:hypothetical protein